MTTASSDLTTGELHGYISRPNTSGGGGDFSTRISDSMTFDNTSGSAITLNIGYAFDGTFSRFGSSLDGLNNGVLVFALRNNPSSTAGYGNILFASSGQDLNAVIEADFDAQTGYFNQRSQSGGAVADYSFTGGFSGGDVAGGMITSLLIPTGVSQLGFALTLGVTCTSTNIVCDFSNTGALQLGAMPSGLSFTSGSGLLFSGLSSGAVPEPATWAMMILGFGAASAALRGRRHSRVPLLLSAKGPRS